MERIWSLMQPFGKVPMASKTMRSSFEVSTAFAALWLVSGS
jgi:hypothetical protein